MKNTPLLERIAPIHELRAEHERAERRYGAARREHPGHPSTDADRIAVAYAQHALFTALKESA